MAIKHSNKHANEMFDMEWLTWLVIIDVSSKDQAFDDERLIVIIFVALNEVTL